MIDWDSPKWGGRVHYAENGSWVGDRHDKSKDSKRDKKRVVIGAELAQEHEASRPPT